MPKARQQLHGQRENDGRVLFGGDLRQSLQVAQLQCRCRLADDIGSILESTRGAKLAFGCDHLHVTNKTWTIDWTGLSTNTAGSR